MNKKNMLLSIAVAIDLFDVYKLKASNTKQNGPRKTLHWSRTLPPELFNSVLFQNKNFAVKVNFIADKAAI